MSQRWIARAEDHIAAKVNVDLVLQCGFYVNLRKHAKAFNLERVHSYLNGFLERYFQLGIGYTLTNKSAIVRDIYSGLALMPSRFVFFSIKALTATSRDEPDMERAAISGRRINPKAG